MTKEERINQAYEVYEQQLDTAARNYQELLHFYKRNLLEVLKTIRNGPGQEEK